jgi:hypothetical protein
VAVGLSALRSGRLLPAGRSLVLISVRGWVDPRTIVQLEELGQFKKSNNLIGNRIRDRTACSIVPQPTTLPRAPVWTLWRREKCCYAGNWTWAVQPAVRPYTPTEWSQLLWIRLWTFGFHKMLGSSWVAASVAASEEGLSFMKLFSWK